MYIITVGIKWNRKPSCLYTDRKLCIGTGSFRYSKIAFKEGSKCKGTGYIEKSIDVVINGVTSLEGNKLSGWSINNKTYNNVDELMKDLDEE